MGFKQVADLDCDNTTAIGGTDKKTGKKNPVSIEGYFIGTRQVTSPKSKNGLSALHTLQTQKGNVGVWGKTNLDQKMKAVLPGQMIRITFVGMVPTKNNPMYKYNVEVDADNSIEVSPESDKPQHGDEDATDEQDANLFEDEEDSDPDAEDRLPDELPPQRAQAPRQAAAAPSAARQQAVQNLLRGARKAA